MRTDACTKVLLTVIAGCLLWLCAMNAGRPVSAQQPMQLGATTVQPVVVVGWGTVDEHGRTTMSMIDGRTGRQSDPNLPIRVIGMPPDVPVKVVGMPARPLDVRMPYTDQAPMPVGITRIKPAAEWEPIRNAAEPEPTRSKPGGR
jgi:hypothetical protein